MRDFASCFSEHAVKVSDSSCSGNGGGSKSIVALDSSSSSVQATITSLYRAQLSSTQKDLLIKVTWSMSQTGPALSLGLDDDSYSHHWNPSFIPSHLLRKKKGARSFVSGSSVIGLYWDFSTARFNSGPEPVASFYIVIIVEAEFVLLLGDLSRDFIKRFEEMPHATESLLVSRREQVLGQAVYSTKGRFSDQGKDHDIVITCKGDGNNNNESELTVSIDRKRVVHVKRLQWNFRGHQPIFIDGSPVDMMWDVRDWCFCRPQGYAVFMFRKRSALESRLWFEEEMLQRQRGSLASLF